MRLLDRYILLEWTKVFVMTLMVIVGIQLLGDFQNNLADLLRYGAGIEQVAQYYLTLLPSFFPAILPVSFMISLLFCLGQLHRNHEITAMRTAGLSIFAITRTLWVAGVLLSGLLFYFNAKLVPWSVEQSRLQWNNLHFASQLAEDVSEEEVGLLYNLTFFNHRDDRLWFINRFNEFNYRAYGITVSELDENLVEQRRFVANEGYYDDVARTWVFMRGRELEFTPVVGDLRRSIAFDERVMDAFSEDPDLMKFLEKRPKDLSFFELRRILRTIDIDDNPKVLGYKVQYYYMLANPMSCLLIVAIAIPFAVTGVRTNPVVGVSKSMGLFIAYFIAFSVAQMLGTRQVISPLWAAWAPNLMMLIAALYFSRRLTRPT